jgi:vacuolar-type H+-ATPase subunit B/Vma2
MCLLSAANALKSQETNFIDNHLKVRISFNIIGFSLSGSCQQKTKNPALLKNGVSAICP